MVYAQHEQLKLSTNFTSKSGLFYIKKYALKNWIVYTITGSKVISGKSYVIDLSSFPKGLYVLKIDNTSIKLLHQ